jgi:hypothetical protein
MATKPSRVVVHRSRGVIAQLDESLARRTSSIVGRKIDAIASIATVSTLDDQTQAIKAEYVRDPGTTTAKAQPRPSVTSYGSGDYDVASYSYSYDDKGEDAYGDDHNDVDGVDEAEYVDEDYNDEYSDDEYTSAEDGIHYDEGQYSRSETGDSYYSEDTPDRFQSAVRGHSASLRQMPAS